MESDETTYRNTPVSALTVDELREAVVTLSKQLDSVLKSHTAAWDWIDAVEAAVQRDKPHRFG